MYVKGGLHTCCPLRRVRHRKARFERLEIPCLVCGQLMAFGEASSSHEELRDEKFKTSEAEGEIDYESHHQKASLGILPMVQWFVYT